MENIIGQYHSWRIKISKTARKSTDSSTCLHSDNSKINTGKSHSNYSVLVDQLKKQISSLESDRKASKQTAEESVSDSEILLVQHKNNTRKIPHTCTKRN